MAVGCQLVHPGFKIFGQGVTNNSMREEKNREDRIYHDTEIIFSI